MTSENRLAATDDVDHVPPLGKMGILGMQHVLVMYAGAVTVPLIIGTALKMPKEQIAMLINADLLCCGIVSIIQALGLGQKIGIRLPVMMGISYAGIGTMIAIGSNPSLGLPGMYGAIIAAGILCFLMVPLIVRTLVLFPPIVTGTTLACLGVSLFSVAIAWAGGGFGAADFGHPLYISIAFLVLATVIAVARFFRGFLSNIAVLLGVLVGTLVAAAFGKVTISGLDQAPWFDMVRPLQFGMPIFDPFAIFTMTLVVIVTMVESIGLFYSLGDILNRKLDDRDFARGLRADALGASIGGLFNTFPYTSYAQNIGLVGVTGVRSRFVCLAAGVILILLGLLPKVAHIVASIPPYVLGGAALVMFGMVAASGVRILQSVEFKKKPHNTYIFAISMGVGLIPTLSQKFFSQFPPALDPLLHSGVLLTVICAVVLNLLFNGIGRPGTVHEQGPVEVLPAKGEEAIG